MELVFQDSKLEYLSEVLHETVVLEQTADLIIPDSYADADRVADAFGTLLVRTEECSSGGASVAGVVQAGVLFVGTEGQLLKVETQIPFSARREFPSEQEDCTLQCRCVLRSVDARTLNSRKLLVRVGIACTLCVYAPKVRTCYDIAEPAENLQLKRAELPLQMPLGLGEKSFVMNEELELPGGKPDIANLLKCLYRTQIQEQRVVGNKAVFKGNVLVHTLYQSDDGELQTNDWNIPFSQYAELERELDEGDLRTELVLTSAETEPDSQIDSRRLLTSVNLLAQCLVTGTQKVAWIEDAFCTDAELEPKIQEWEVSGILDRQTFHESAAAESEAQIGNVVDAWVYPDEASQQRDGERMRFSIPLNCNVLCFDKVNGFQGKTLRPTLSLETDISEKGSCAVTGIESGDLFCAAGNGALSVRVPVHVTVESSAAHHLNVVCGGEITPPAEQTERRPALILRRTETEEEIWQIAKTYRAPMQAIVEANALKGTTVSADTLLLIPM